MSARCPADGLGICPGQAEQRPQVAPAPLAGCPPPRAARCPGPAAAAASQPGHLQYGPLQCIYPLLPQLFKTGVAQAARPVLPGMFRAGPLRRANSAGRNTRSGTPSCAHSSRTKASSRSAVSRAGRGSHGRHSAQSRTPAVRPAAGAAVPCCRPRRTPPRPSAAALRTANGSCSQHRKTRGHTACRKNRRVHQRLKSTSIKRVWAPSQPSGTVLVSPWRFLATMHSAVSASTSAPSGFWLA